MLYLLCFFFNDTATTELYTLSLHDALPISTRNSSLAPVPAVGGLTFQALHSRNFHTCAIATGGAAYCWGVNNQGELGDSTHTEKLAPQAVLGGHTILEIAAGSSHSCGIATDATTYCWGNNQSGQLGDGTGTERRIPTPVIGGHAFIS